MSETPSDPAVDSAGEPAHDPEAPDDTTLGGYFAVHDRPPGFEGLDGNPYTVSVEAEKTADLRSPWIGYLVFPRWAETGLGIVGHVETPVLWQGTTREAILAEAGALPLFRVQELLEEAIRSRDDRDDSEAG